MRWWGRLVRKPAGHHLGEVFQTHPTRRRPQGRPGTHWRYHIISLCKSWRRWMGKGRSAQTVAASRKLTAGNRRYNQVYSHPYNMVSKACQQLHRSYLKRPAHPLCLGRKLWGTLVTCPQSKTFFYNERILSFRLNA